MPVNWTDGVSPVNAANLEIMEADTAAKQAASEKAQANGYAPLDATAKVPLVNLPPLGGGGGVDYIGTWGSGVAYKKGDVIRHNGNDYMAVNVSTGVTPPAPSTALSILPPRLGQPGCVESHRRQCGRGVGLVLHRFVATSRRLPPSITWRLSPCTRPNRPVRA